MQCHDTALTPGSCFVFLTRFIYFAEHRQLLQTAMDGPPNVTTRERLLQTFSGKRPDRLPNVEFGYWEETLHLWHAQGLPAHVTSDAEMEKYLQLEGITIFPEVPIRNGLFPAFEKKTLSESDGRRTFIDEDGTISETFVGHSTMPRYIRFGIQERADWEAYRVNRLDPLSRGRIGDIRKALEAARDEGMPSFFHAGSLYGWLRNWMGVEEFSVTLMTDRKWVEEMMDHLTELTLSLISRGMRDDAPDLIWWWEDMCYNKGSLMSPRLFHELMVPRYKRITAAARERGVTINVLDCDGKIDQLVPGWLEAGINCMFPLEVAHTDAYALRRQYGDALLLMGGVDKLALIAGKEAIDRELARLVPLVQAGRFIPCVDHRVPADVTLENYLYYLEKKQDLLRA